MMILLFWVKSSGPASDYLRDAIDVCEIRLGPQDAAAEGSRVRPMGPLSFGPLTERWRANDHAAERNFHSLRAVRSRQPSQLAAHAGHANRKATGEYPVHLHRT